MGITLRLQGYADSILHYSHLPGSKDDGHMSAWTRFGTLTGISQVYRQVCDLAPRLEYRRAMIVVWRQQPASVAFLPDCFVPLFVSDLSTVWPSGLGSSPDLGMQDSQVPNRNQVQCRRVLLHSQNHPALPTARSDFAGQAIV
jgi:hypothetical protein